MSKVSHHPEIIWERVDDQVALVHAGTGEFCRLNGVGSLVWEICDGLTLEELVARLAERFPDVDRELLTTDARRFLHALQQGGWITWEESEAAAVAEGQGAQP